MKKKTEETKNNENEQNPSEMDSIKAQLARTLADYDNLQKRVSRERSEMASLATMRFLMRFLPIFDMIEDAQKHLNDAGLGISLKVLTDTLKEEGVEPIVPNLGDAFDESLYEAIDTVIDPEKDEDTVAELALKGYRFTDGSVIRHAKVKVFKKS